MKKSKITDFDPEELLDPAPSSSDAEDADSSGAEDDNAGREHYADVGKSKLRRKEVVPLGPQYTGTQVSRNAVEDEDSDDPFAKRFDEDGSGSDDDEDSEAEFENGVAQESGSGSDEDDDESGDEEQGLDQNAEADSDSASDDDASEDDDTNDAAETRALMSKNKEDVRELMKDQNSLVTSLAAAAQSDVAKGQAIKAQRKTFDSFLNTRVRLQKALIATNSMVAEDHKDESAPTASVEAAEAAAVLLLNNLTRLRASIEEARTGEKRKRTAFGPSTASSDIWDRLCAQESSAKKQRRAVMEKWSAKTRTAKIATAQRQLNVSAEQTLTEVLDSQLTNSTHLVARTQMPRSCAPIQSASSKPLPDVNIYDDADFYGLLLKELLEQRSAELSNNGTAEFVVQAPWQVAREAKTRKVVDTKASKGRRLRYTVHEKLQNFMAPEQRGLWGERQRDELFTSLFGQRLALGEQDDVVSEEEDAVDAAEQGLMLFRS
ncbi:TRAUB-domain-containing protein [Paraphaeosphaeria sporulosa]|uniref:Protein BFR2 n=1 Tax=Paraphaeosphaeria sporulosa TaxID=1460663 RepID=A0A177BXX9_9PLEO|nr:TRAUB-domain-containing protein [Paraphaeosphaeria sporulosa]OAF99985.1 TRAUB-domain-containing protein [Paraphaeosphaeria sporulosa]